MISFESSQLTRQKQVAVIMHYFPVAGERSLSKSKDPLGSRLSTIAPRHVLKPSLWRHF
jgi:hypothetical protein